MDKPLSQATILQNRRKLWLKTGLVALAIITVLLVLRHWISPSISANRIRTGIVERGPVESTVNAAGVVKPEFEQTISCPFNTHVLRILEQPGALLSPGQPIAILDTTEARSEVDRVSDQIRLKENQRDQLKIALNRSQRDLVTREEILALRVKNFESKRDMEKLLYDKHITTTLNLRQAELDYEISKLEYDQAKSDLSEHQEQMNSQIKGLEIEIRLLTSELTEKQKRLAKATLRADQNNVLTWLNLKEGEAVHEGEALARVADLSSWKVECTISDLHATRLHTELPAKLKLEDGYISGTVSRVNPTIENGALILIIALDDPRDARLRSNMKLDTYIVTEGRLDALRVQMGPFTGGAGVQQVFVLDNGTARRVEAEFGISSRDYIEVVNGLRLGDQVIISNMDDYSHLTKLRVTGRLEADS